MNKLSKSQIAGLDWMRGIAAQLVLIGHLYSRWSGPLGLRKIPSIQEFAVIVFFVLSGFLICHSVRNKHPDYTFRDYLIDRFARIFVTYAPVLLFIILADRLLLRNSIGVHNPTTVLANLLMLQDFPLYRLIDWFPAFDRLGTGQPLWSVAMEWWLYVFFGVLYFRIARGERISLSVWILFLPAAFVAFFNLVNGMLTYTWLGGALVAVFFWHRGVDRLPWGLVACLIIWIALYRLLLSPGLDFYDLRFTFALCASIAATLLAVEQVGALRWLLEATSRPAAFLAALSYPLYLTHYEWVEYATYLDPPPNVAAPLAAFAIANLVAWLFFVIFDRHHKRFANWLRNSMPATSDKIAS